MHQSICRKNSKVRLDYIILSLYITGINGVSVFTIHPYMSYGSKMLVTAKESGWIFVDNSDSCESLESNPSAL